jgi:hypothetical protein
MPFFALLGEDYNISKRNVIFSNIDCQQVKSSGQGKEYWNFKFQVTSFKYRHSRETAAQREDGWRRCGGERSEL